MPIVPREQCLGCGWLLPAHVGLADCAICEGLQDGAEHEGRCCCKPPLPLRLYLGHWLCICGCEVR